MKEDERVFFEQMKIENGKKIHERKTPREIINNLGINNKRAWYLLSKWDKKGYYDYGVCLDMGWLTEKGVNKQI